MTKPAKHGRDHFVGEDAVPKVIEVDVFGDTTAIVAGNGARYFFIAKDLDGTALVEAHMGVITPGSSVARVQLHNVSKGYDMLLDAFRIEVDSGDLHSATAADWSQPDETGDPPKNRVNWGDQIRVDVDNAPTGGEGLQLQLTFHDGEAWV